ncbi:MAG: hypothetical protein OHK0015_21440 [Chloroflexi bacterium OHK40]
MGAPGESPEHGHGLGCVGRFVQHRTVDHHHCVGPEHYCARRLGCGGMRLAPREQGWVVARREREGRERRRDWRWSGEIVFFGVGGNGREVGAEGPQ